MPVGVGQRCRYCLAQSGRGREAEDQTQSTTSSGPYSSEWGPDSVYDAVWPEVVRPRTRLVSDSASPRLRLVLDSSV